MKKIDAKLYSYIGGRPENEDSALLVWVSDTTLNAVVADGLGGQGDGKAASSHVCSALSLFANDESDVDGLQIADAIAEANETLMQKQTNKFHMKTTVVFLRIQGNTAIWAHIGDSRLYHFYNGELTDYTLDHSLSQMAVLMGQITRDQIPGHSGRSRLYHAMGSEGETADVSEKITLQPGKHAFLLCSDGYWEYLSDREIAQELSASETAEQWHCRMLSLVESRCPPETDNRTAITIMMEA